MNAPARLLLCALLVAAAAPAWAQAGHADAGWGRDGRGEPGWVRGERDDGGWARRPRDHAGWERGSRHEAGAPRGGRDERDRDERVRDREAAWAQVSRDDAAGVAQRVTGGRVLAVERAEAGGRPAWRVKVVTPRGEVQVLLIDMATGRPV